MFLLNKNNKFQTSPGAVRISFHFLVVIVQNRSSKIKIRGHVQIKVSIQMTIPEQVLTC